MNQIPVNKFLESLSKIEMSRPSFKKRCDSSNGKCDAIGLVRGALIQSGVTGIKDMKDIDSFARTLSFRLRNEESKSDIAFKYNSFRCKYTDIGIVISIEPRIVIHMTRLGIKKSNSKKWNCFCVNPYLSDAERLNVVKVETKLYESPSLNSNYYTVTKGANVYVRPYNAVWVRARHGRINGYMLNNTLADESVDIAELEKAYELIGKFIEKVKNGK